MSTTIIRNVELHYPRLVRPHSPFGAEVWDVQVRTSDEDTVEQLKAAGVNMKAHTDGYWHANVKRKTEGSKGPNKPPVLVDGNKQPWDLDVNIGNGSIGNLKLFSYDYNTAGRSGRSAILSLY